MVVPVISSLTAKLNLRIAGDLFQGVVRTNLPLRQTDRPLAVDAN